MSSAETNKSTGDVVREIIDDAIDPVEKAVADAKAKLEAMPDSIQRTAGLAFFNTVSAGIGSARSALNIPDDVGGDAD